MREFDDLSHVVALLSWDQETNMPRTGAAARAAQLSTLNVLRHERLCDPRLGELLELGAEGEPSQEQAAMIRNLEHDRDRAVRLPVEFVRRMAAAESRGASIWREARAADDFGMYRPVLEEIVGYKREQAELIGYEGEPYDALLDAYEPGMTVARLEPLLASLRVELERILGAIRGRPAAPVAPFVSRTFEPAAQWELTLRILRDIGFDLGAGRQDISAHPFSTSISLQDVRLTTRLDESNPFDAIYSSIHEAGHGMYEQGFDPRFAGTPLAQAPSHGIHESQSRMWENWVGRSRPFIEHYTPIMREAFPDALADADAGQIYDEVTRVEPTLIRVESDEVTYNLHILIRFELELALLRGELEVAELPDAWNDTYERTLGIRPPSDALGVMQDIHWSHGSHGYFPSYTLGNLYAAVLWEALVRDLPDAEAGFAEGSFAPVLEWLREHVHRLGYLHSAEDTVRIASGGRGLEVGALVRYLDTKYETA